MGKKARKTRWRALAIDTGNQSDSEESHTALHASKSYYQSAYAPAGYENAHGGGNGHHYHHNGYQPAAHYGGVQRSYRAATGGGGGGVPRGRFGHHSHSHSHHHHSQHSYSRQQALLNGGECKKDDETKTTPQSAASAAGANVDGKITFNEDEYTRITTPRQDVLFKKGYLSKPKTYQTQTSTGASTISTGNSTGNGTPDHQSADGTEGTDLEYESQFVFPNGFVDQNGIYYINTGYEPYPLVVYNPQMCYPEYVASQRSKRLSTGSLTESTSPHNEETSQELSHSGGETVNYPEFSSMYNVLLPGYYFNNGMPPEMELSHGEPRKIKKRRRRKLSKPVPEGNWTTSSSDDYDESEEMVSEIENRIIQGTHRPPTAETPPSASNSEPVEDGSKRAAEEDAVEEREAGEVHAADAEAHAEVVVDEEKEEKEVREESVDVEVKKVLKADAKEFVPRFFHHPHHHHHQHRHAPPQFIAVPLPPPFLHGPPPPHMMPPPAQIIAAPPPPPHVEPAVILTDTPATATATATVAPTLTATQSEVISAPDIIALEVAPVTEVPAPAPTSKHIDIAKIVSKLEEAAKEQRRAPKVGNQHQQQRGRRNFTRAAPPPVPIELAEKRSAIRVREARMFSTREASTGTTPTGAKNYAQMLSKKSAATSPMKRHALGGKTRSPSKEAPATIASASISAQTNMAVNAVSVHLPQQAPKVAAGASQWISVQSRKKRKNKNQEHELDVELEQEQECEVAPLEVPVSEAKVDDGFESYDVTKLEDVVVVHIAPVPVPVPEEVVKDIVDNKAVVPDVVPDVPAPVVPVPVALQLPVEEEAQDIEVVTTQGYREAAEEEEFDKLIRTLEELEAKTPQKKKSLTRSTSKRVMITDLPAVPAQMEDFPEPPIKVQPNIKVNLEVKSKKSKSKSKSSQALSKEVVNEVPVQKVLEPIIQVPVVPVPEADVEVEVPAEEVSEVLAEVVEDAKLKVDAEEASEESSEKKSRKKKKKPLKKASTVPETPSTSIPTTPSTSASVDECSYNFLLTDSLLEEERTNLEVSEELDKIIQRGMFTSLEERIKSLNITAMSADDGFFRSMSSMMEASAPKGAKEDDLTTILAKTTNIFKAKRPMCQHEPTTTGSFLDLASLHEDPGISPGASCGGYPITNAVRDWMVRTRETTPEVELLKSPRTILKETQPSTAGSIKESWSLTPESSFEDEDLLECWDDLEVGMAPSEVGAAKEEQRTQLEASLEVYESMYGKNEDFKQIQAEMEERKRNGTLPQHGGLPYRAICCSLM